MAIVLIATALSFALLAPALCTRQLPPLAASATTPAPHVVTERGAQYSEDAGAAEEEDKAAMEQWAGPGDGAASSPPEEQSPLDEPPPEFFPPHRNDVPRLEAAAGRKLKFGITIPCKERLSLLYWYIQDRNGKGREQSSVNVTCRNGYCHAYEQFSDLEFNTEYQVCVHPFIKSNSTRQGLYHVNWYNITSTAPNTTTIKALTCEESVQPVGDLMVHTSGSTWLALSWLPPKAACLTQFEYKVRVYQAIARTKKGSWSAGSFWTNATWATQGLTTPCFAWPDRHCLLITEDHDLRAKREYTIEVEVIRKEDNFRSNLSEVVGRTEPSASGPPEDLRCVRTEPTALELRWRCPLQPGGVLEKYFVKISAANGTSFQLEQNTTLQPQYSQKVDNLEPNTWYEISVWFETRGIEDGSRRSAAPPLRVWTPPFENATSSDKPCTLWNNSPASNNTPASNNNTPASSLRSAKNGNNTEGSGTTPWVWIAACVFLLLLVAVALFVGHRWGSRRLWILAPHDDGRNGFLDVKCASAGAKAGDQAALCSAAGSQPSCTPPSIVLEYAEVDLASGRAWAAAPRTGKGSLPDYEEIKDRNGYVEQPYAVGRGAGAAAPHLYAELKQPTGPPPPVPTSKPPVYAEVNKKRPPAAAPLCPRPTATTATTARLPAHD